MNIDEPYLSALKAHGYTRDEASFLYLVATHSGYFVARQFLAFSGASWGKRTTLFRRKLQANKHARAGALIPRHRAVYHVFSRALYRDIGRDNLRNQGHEREYIEARLAVLDFVLANPELAYLE